MTGDRAARHGAADEELGLELQPELDVAGLAAAFGVYASERRIPADRRREALGEWLDELIAAEQRGDDPARDDG
ncbi:hypothetical protein [Jiangella asiatica]|uniref:Uncharacterized protein n=1 Tax=Jiangella asiatica TaxID=2530372 RepID=A0A4R5DA19_9ACTN|nr:hypothetical protein [Jiangella asiatica]TDE08611.1 hypothetical protein E1269_16955 [Jiangella asiatica]